MHVTQLAPAQAPRLENQLRLNQAVRAMVVEGQVPHYFAHMRLETQGKTQDLLLGSARRLAPGVSIIDWQTAPLAQIFFQSEEGDDYELEIEGRLLEGKLVEKNLLTFQGGTLVRIEFASGAYVRDGEGSEWRFEAGPFSREVPLRPAEKRTPFRSPLEVTLDPAQQRVVDLPVKRHALLLGEAGFGKTTVALHRLASIERRITAERGGPDTGQARAGEAFRGLVLVPTIGLRKLTELMLERKNVPGVEVWTWDAWAAKVARAAFPDLPERQSFCFYAGVVRAKRHRALLPELEAYVNERPEPFTVEGKRRTRALASRYDLEQIFGDRERMTRVIEASEGAIKKTAIEELAEHTRVQFSESTERQYRHVDAEALITADGRSIDEGTPMENNNSADVEDYAVMFEIDRLRSKINGGKQATVPRYDAVVVDEAQEFSPLELAVAGRAVRQGGTLIVSGDAAQQVDPGTDFPGWDGVMEATGTPDHERAVLTVNYRCPPPVTDLGRGILDPSVALPIDASIERRQFTASAHLTMWLIEELGRISHQDRTASIAVICRSAGIARTFSKTLKHGVDHALSLGGHFDFAPGVLVTAVPEVKGLEFDYVFVPDADANTYPDTAESRRTLYVAVTRATHRLAICAAGKWSTLLPPAS